MTTYYVVDFGSSLASFADTHDFVNTVADLGHRPSSVGGRARIPEGAITALRQLPPGADCAIRDDETGMPYVRMGGYEYPVWPESTGPKIATRRAVVRITTESTMCPVYPGIQHLGDLTVAPEGPKIAAALAAGGIRAEVPLSGAATGPSGTGEYTILPSEPGTAHFTPLLTDAKPLDNIGVLECIATVYISHPDRGCIGLSAGTYTILRGRTGTCGFCGTYVTRRNGQWTADDREACPAPASPYGYHARKPDALRDIPAPAPGAGKAVCCGNHRQRCLNGQHQWAIWVKDGELQRTPDTLHCHKCGGVCTAEEKDSAFPVIPPGQIEAEVAADVHRLGWGRKPERAQR